MTLFFPAGVLPEEPKIMSSAAHGGGPRRIIKKPTRDKRKIPKVESYRHSRCRPAGRQVKGSGAIEIRVVGESENLPENPTPMSAELLYSASQYQLVLHYSSIIKHYYDVVIKFGHRNNKILNAAYDYVY